MYTRAATNEMKEMVLQSFTTAGGCLQIVLATTAFGMGIDYPDIHYIIHWKPPSDLEAYVQEAGRDMEPAIACLLHGTSKQHLSKQMVEYSENNSECRR